MAAQSSLLLSRLEECLPAESISCDPRVLQSNSEDYYWFSNVLEEDLHGYSAEVVVWPADETQLAAVLQAAYETRTPVTVRGGGTGNYGQCVPLHGGLVINMGRLNRVLALETGRARVQAGVRFVDLDEAARASNQEIQIYPSTYLTATFAGFVCGGSMGVGSATHGVLADGNVLGATVYPVSGRSEPETVSGTDLSSYIHAYGTTGVLADVTVPLTPRRPWEQAVVSFTSIFACHAFCLALLDDHTIDKRLITSVEPAVVRHFMRARLAFRPDRTAALLMFGAGQLAAVAALAARHGGELDCALPADTRTRLTDFSWNHTTLWVKKADANLTYLQVGFSIERFEEQVRAIRQEYGDSFGIHGEYVRLHGSPFMASLPIVPFLGRAELDRLVDFLESIGVTVANPHRYLLEEGSHVDNVDELLVTKRRNDPAGLLNPGKLRAALDSEQQLQRPYRQSSLGLARTRMLS